MAEVHLSQKALKFLEKLEPHVRERVRKRLKNIESTPVPSDAKFIKRQGNKKVFRYRIGHFRALYSVDKDKVLIAKIDKRPRVYQNS